MKKFLSLSLIAVICFLSLSGCSGGNKFSAATHKYILSAIGFDKENGYLTVTLEAVVINSEESADNSKRVVISGKSKRVYDAFKLALTKAVEPLETGHCTTIILGKNIKGKCLENILIFLNEKQNVNPAISLVSADNALKLLKTEPVSSVAIGYDLLSMQSSISRHFNIKFENRLYNFLNETQILLIPYFKINGKEYCLKNVHLYKSEDYTFSEAKDPK
ncbi:MAG: hypothetical protein IKT38_05540 [Clostridia bacterium]|nr:hypothetical protein [Clostridia bacterium]